MWLEMSIQATLARTSSWYFFSAAGDKVVVNALKKWNKNIPLNLLIDAAMEILGNILLNLLCS